MVDPFEEPAGLIIERKAGVEDPEKIEIFHAPQRRDGIVFLQDQHEFGEDPKVYHIDLYRIERAAEVVALGIDEILDRGAVVLVEWGERFPELWPEDRVEIRLDWVDDSARQIRIDGLAV